MRDALIICLSDRFLFIYFFTLPIIVYIYDIKIFFLPESFIHNSTLFRLAYSKFLVLNQLGYLVNFKFKADVLLI